MRSGRRRARFPSFSRPAVCLLTAALVVSCGGPAARFERALERLDSVFGPPKTGENPDTYKERGLPAEDAAELLAAAARSARTQTDWLRLMNRAFQASERSGDSRLAAAVADKARKAYPSYEAIALCACEAYLEADRPVDALALFSGPLDPRSRGAWFTEAFVKSYRLSGRSAYGAENVELLSLAAANLGKGEPAVDAALLRMGEGDASGAAGFLRYAQSLGAEIDPDLAWDCGALESVLANPVRGTDGASLLREADAALLMNQPQWAREYLLDAVSQAPDYSWKPYAALARLEEEGPRRDYWYDRMIGLFPQDPQAARAYAAHLARTDRRAEALRELASFGDEAAKGESGSSGGPGAQDAPARPGLSGEHPEDPGIAVLAAELRTRGGSPEVAASQALRISNAFPDDPYAQDWALGELAAAERYGQVEGIYRQLKSRGVNLSHPWYYDALPFILDGKIEDAIAVIEREGAMEPGWRAPFALGVLYRRAGDYRLSVERFRIAAFSAGDAETKARALTEMGKSLAAAGDSKGARGAWASALSVYPDSVEALRLYNGR